jgi:hypothetical protein
MVTKTKAGELLTPSQTGLSSDLLPARTINPSGSLVEQGVMSLILLPPNGIGHTTAIAQEIALSRTHLEGE